MSVAFWVWLLIILFTIVLEAVTMELVSIWFTIGAIPSFIMAATNNVDWKIQVISFVVVTLLLIFSLRKIAKKWLDKSTYKTNKDSFVGQKYRLLERCDFETLGAIKINDVVWSVKEKQGNTIEVGEIVRVVKIEGNKLIVESIKED